MASPEVLVVGETVIDLVEGDGVTTEHVGGSPANVALTLARLGNPVRFVTDLAHYERGERAQQHLAASTMLVEPRALNRTSTAHARLQPDGSARYTFDISFNPTPSNSAALLTCTQDRSPPSCHPAPRSSPHSSTRVTSTLDPHIRPSLIGTPETARETFEALARRIDIVKLSDEDADGSIWANL